MRRRADRQLKSIFLARDSCDDNFYIIFSAELLAAFLLFDVKTWSDYEALLKILLFKGRKDVWSGQTGLLMDLGTKRRSKKVVVVELLRAEERTIILLTPKC